MFKRELDIPEPERISLDEIINSDVWPVYHSNEVDIGNRKSPLAITTLWTQRQNLTKKLDPKDYSAIGQCFSPRGVNLILRELIANPHIRTLVTWGRDATNTGDQLGSFFNNGFNEDRTINGIDQNILTLPNEIPLEELDQLRKSIDYVDLRSEFQGADYGGLATRVTNIASSLSDSQPWRDFGMRYPLASEVSNTMPSENMGYTIRGNTIEEVWLDILDTIVRFGKAKDIPGEDPKRDAANIFAIVTGSEDHETIQHPKVFERIPNFERSVAKYVDQFTNGEPIPGSAYSYGEELFAHRSEGEIIDQIEYIIGKLSKASGEHTGKAYAAAYNVGRHITASETPCLRGMQFLAISPESDDKFQLNMMAHFATHDMFEGWPSNILGMRNLQKRVLEEVQPSFENRGLSLELGSVSTLSSSAHFYGGQQEAVRKTLEDHPPEKYRTYELEGNLNQDPRGNYKLSFEDGKIQIDHLHPVTSAVLETGEFSRVRDAQRWLGNKRTSDPLHSIYLGGELGKIEVVQKLQQKGIDIVYRQDQQLRFD